MPKGHYKRRNPKLYEELDKKKRKKRTNFSEFIPEPERVICRTCKRVESRNHPDCVHYLFCPDFNDKHGNLIKEGHGEVRGSQTCKDHKEIIFSTPIDRGRNMMNMVGTILTGESQNERAN